MNINTWYSFYNKINIGKYMHHLTVQMSLDKIDIACINEFDIPKTGYYVTSIMYT